MSDDRNFLEIRTAGRETLIVKESRYKSMCMHLEILPVPLEVFKGSAYDDVTTAAVGLYRDQAEKLRDWLNKILPPSPPMSANSTTGDN